MREKSQMHYKEAQEEAKMLRESADNISPDTDDEENSDKNSTSVCMECRFIFYFVVRFYLCIILCMFLH